LTLLDSIDMSDAIHRKLVGLRLKLAGSAHGSGARCVCEYLPARIQERHISSRITLTEFSQARGRRGSRPAGYGFFLVRRH